MKIGKIFLFLIVLLAFFSCGNRTADTTRQKLLEVEGKFLYSDQLQDIMPPNVNAKDSIEIAKSYIRKWVTDVLLYENAERNITNKAEIDQLLEDYRKSLIIHQYQQKLLQERLPKEPSEDEIKVFYEKYKNQLVLKENVIQGILLITPANAPQLANVRNWVKLGNTKSLESIEKYSMQHAISYDYFAERWIPFTEILKKLPLQLEDQTSYLSGRRFLELSDSTKHYFLNIKSSKLIGQTEPYDMAKPKIINLIMNKLKADFISNFEDEIYNDAIKNESVTFFKEIQ
jgi:hypothetical protein